MSLKVKKTGTIEETHTITLTYNEILDMFKDAGVELNDKPMINLERASNKSVIRSGLGCLRTPTQKLEISVSVTKRVED